MIDKLEMFIALARESHFGRAAESLGITQPSLSAGIKQLETQLGVQLVWRGSRYGGLTPEGARVLEWARSIVGDVRTMKDEMRAVREGLSGNVRLAAVPTALTMVAELTSAFAKEHPGVRFTILSRTSAEILTMLENLEIDGGVTYLDNEPLGKVASVPMYRERYSVVCNANSDLAERASIGWHELAGAPLCLLTQDMQNRRIINQNLAEAGVVPQPTIESNSTVVLVAHVETGDWITILPHRLAGFLSAGKTLVRVPLEEPRKGHTLGMIAAARDPQTPVMTAILQMARKIGEREAD